MTIVTVYYKRCQTSHFPVLWRILPKIRNPSKRVPET